MVSSLVVNDRSEMYRLDASDPRGVLFDRSGMDETDLAQIDELMQALSQLRAAEDRLSEASSRYMKLGPTDMRAIHFLIVNQHKGTDVTAGAIASHLEISTASTTKLLDRLERAGHIHRQPHPGDRRSVVIRLEGATYTSAMDTVGRQQARRIKAAAMLTREEREVVVRFLRQMTADLAVNELAAGD